MSQKRYNNLIARSGSALVMVLWTFVLLIVITAVVAQTSRIDTRISAVTGDQLRCKWACRAGLEKAIGILNDDEQDSDCQDDLWCYNDEELVDIELDGCSYSVKVIDEASKININTANEKLLMYLPDMTEEIANAILDWRDSNDDIRTGSVEAGYYINLTPPYQIKNQPFGTIRELLRVKDVTEELLYGPEIEGQDIEQEGQDITVNEGWINYLTCYSLEYNKNAEDENRININKAKESNLRKSLDIRAAYAKWIVDNRKKGFKGIADLISSKSPDKASKSTANSKDAAPLDVQTVLDIADKIRISGDKMIFGKININTASKTVLTALLEGRDDIAEDIIAYRMGQLYGISSLGELTQVGSLKKDSIKKIIDSITVRSCIFTVRSTASANLTDTRRTIEAVVDRRESPALIVYYCEGAKY